MRRWGVPLLCILLLAGAAAFVALVPPEAEEAKPTSCGASPVAIVLGRDVPPDIAEECDGKARRATLLAAVCAFGALAGVAVTVGLRERSDAGLPQPVS